MSNNNVIAQPNGDIKVMLSPLQIGKQLEGKLSPNDINKGMDIVSATILTNQTQEELFNGCANTNCPLCKQSPFRILPNGSTRADVMFINNRATEYETYLCMSHCDKASVFLSLILNKMNVERNDVYCTTFEKCPAHVANPDNDKCYSFYLTRELSLVKPKVIVCNGLALLQRMKTVGLIDGLPGNEGYGIIYDVIAKTNIPVPQSDFKTKIIAIYELNKALQKTGEEYDKCKNTLWNQLLTAFKASVQGGQ